MNPRTTRLPCLLLFLAVLAAQGWFAQRFAVPIEDEPDGKIYLALAHNLLTHGVYSPDAGPDPAPTSLRLPGYPWMIAGVFALVGDGNQAAVRFFQALLSTLTYAGVAWLAFLWEPEPARRPRAALIAFGLAAVCPFTAIYNATILAENLTLFLSVCLTLAATWAFRASTWPKATLRWATAGLLAGAVQLVRPEAGLFAAAVGFTLAGFGLFGPEETRRWDRLPGIVRDGAVFSCAFVAALAPWTVRNARVFHVFAPLPPANVTLPGEMDNHGFNAWYRTWADSERSLEPYYWNMTDGEPADMDELPDRAFDSEAERARTAALFERYNAPAAPDDPASPPIGLTPELDEAFGQLAHERATRAPWRYHVVLPLRRAVNLWFGPHATYYGFDGPLFPPGDIKPGFKPHFWLPVFFGLVCGYTILGLAGWWRLAKTRPPVRADAWRWLTLVVLIVVPRWVYLATLENTEPRYTVEFFPFLCVLGGLALSGGTGYGASMKPFRSLLLGAALLCLAPDLRSAPPAAGAVTAQAKAETLFTTIIGGDASKAFDGLLAGSVIAEKQSGAAYNLRNQLENGMRIYGRPVGFDLVEEKSFGPSLVRLVYIFRLEKYPLVWEFFFYRSGGDAWMPIEVRFNDQLTPFKFDRPTTADAAQP